jgi:hypothetical protein
MHIITAAGDSLAVYGDMTHPWFQPSPQIYSTSGLGIARRWDYFSCPQRCTEGTDSDEPKTIVHKPKNVGAKNLQELIMFAESAEHVVI